MFNTKRWLVNVKFLENRDNYGDYGIICKHRDEADNLVSILSNDLKITEKYLKYPKLFSMTVVETNVFKLAFEHLIGKAHFNYEFFTKVLCRD
jgi:hypothetical protein